MREKSFLNFVERYSASKQAINEGINPKKIDDAMNSIDKLLSKKIANLFPIQGMETTLSNNKVLMSRQYIVIDKKSKHQVFQLNFENRKGSYELYSIDFFADMSMLMSGKGKSSLTIYAIEGSIVYYMPIIWTVVNNHDYSISQKKAIEIGRSVFKGSKDVKESMLQFGMIKYHIYEGLTLEEIDEAKDEVDDDVKDYKNKKMKEMQKAYVPKKKDPEGFAKFRELEDEYNAIRNAIAGGAKTMQELNLALKKNVQVRVEVSDEVQKQEKELQAKRDDPKQVFKKMQVYVNMVIDGTNPSLILCGAPGVGKTFRVKQQLKAHNYTEGQNLFTIKGKCTPRMLYTSLYEFQRKGDVLVIDDADALVGPKAPEDAINILKGALDSTSDDEGRLVSYGISGKLVDEEGEPIPKRFYYNGSIIIITNWNAGSLDTALRGRSYIQDISFTNEDVLNIIKELLPKIDTQHLSEKSKVKALDFLEKLNKDGEDMEISIRTFTICAKIYESASKIDDVTEEDVEAMIREQMRLQASRRKNDKY